MKSHWAHLLLSVARIVEIHLARSVGPTHRAIQPTSQPNLYLGGGEFASLFSLGQASHIDAINWAGLFARTTALTAPQPLTSWCAFMTTPPAAQFAGQRDK